MSIDRDEEIVKAIPVKELKEDFYLVFFTKLGMVKKTTLNLYKAQRYNRPISSVKYPKR